MGFVFRNIPNLLTLLRMAAVPVFASQMMKENLMGAMVVFLAAEITDVLDGIIARHYNIITLFGKVADPLADKLMQLTALFMFAESNRIPGVIPWLVLAKDLFLLISGLYIINTKEKVDVSSKWFGKLASVLIFAAIMLVFFEAPRAITDVIFWVCAGMALFAALMYIRNYFNQVKNNA
ncbi:MAG: CDP-diacylglycerol--glycerol-3-phosphate 3-phosphatidyltransferase [Clostridiaceae bacterium]|nr:CDP-diacylglycerol--glycerol-3-phosphate 3-phosphatidyltransferase [Clostridiaceae bacterium]